MSSRPLQQCELLGRRKAGGNKLAAQGREETRSPEMLVGSVSRGSGSLAFAQRAKWVRGLAIDAEDGAAARDLLVRTSAVSTVQPRCCLHRHVPHEGKFLLPARGALTRSNADVTPVATARARRVDQ